MDLAKGVASFVPVFTGEIEWITSSGGALWAVFGKDFDEHAIKQRMNSNWHAYYGHEKWLAEIDWQSLIIEKLTDETDFAHFATIPTVFRDLGNIPFQRTGPVE